MSYSIKIDKIFRGHERNIEECLRQIIASVEANIDGKQPNEHLMKYSFDCLQNRLMKLCKNVQIEYFDCQSAEPTDHIDIQRSVGEKPPVREMVEKRMNVIPKESSTADCQNVTETDNAPESETKKRKLSEQFEIEKVVAVKESSLGDRPSREMAEKLRRQTCAILGATSKLNMIQATCFLCKQTIKFDFIEWKVHYLSHTQEVLPKDETYFHNKFQLKGYMCKICDYFKVYAPRVLQHIVKEHGKTSDSAVDDMDMVTLLPNLRRFNNYIITSKYRHISMKHRYRCGIEDCETNCGNSVNFRQHFMMNHQSARVFHCPHCKEGIRCDSDDNEVKLSTIQSHINKHGSVLIECSICQSHFSSDSNVLTHMLARHGSVNFMYRRDVRDGPLISRMEEVIVLFECCRCKCRFDTSSLALRHYLRVHNSHHADFQIILLFKKSVSDGDLVSYSMEDMDPGLRFQQNFICGWCQKYFKSKYYLIDHHNLMHQPRNLALEFSRTCWTDDELLADQNLDFDQYLMYHCSHCNDPVAYADADDVYNHWIDNHNEQRSSKPFRFTVAQLVQCHYCAVISTFEGLKKHHPKKHPTVPFIIDNLNDRSKCGLCLDDNADTPRAHFENKHQTLIKANLFSPVPLSNDILKNLISIKGEEKLKCGYCSELFEMEDEFQRHHTKEHQLLEPYSQKFYDNESVHLIAGCCEAKLEPNQLFTHFKEHNILSKHRLKQYYWETLIICGNGLVINKHNLLSTEHDDSEEFEDFIKEISY